MAESAPAGIGTTERGGSFGDPNTTEASRIIFDFKAQVENFPVSDFDWFQYVKKYSSETGGMVEITYRNHNSGELPEVAEGEEPVFSHADLTKLLVDVKKYAKKPAITKEMIEDSRFDELREALDAVGVELRNTYIARFLDAVRTGPYDTNDVPEDYGGRSWANAAAHLYSADHSGTPIAQSQAGHVYNTGNVNLFLGDIHLMQRHIREHGFKPTHLLIAEDVWQKLQDLSAFTAISVEAAPAQELQTLGELRGLLGGLRVVVSPWVNTSEMICIDQGAKPIAYVSRREPVLETRESDFDIEVRALSARFGFKARWKGAMVVATLAA